MENVEIAGFLMESGVQFGMQALLLPVVVVILLQIQVDQMISIVGLVGFMMDKVVR
jgi:hypothetical protein